MPHVSILFRLAVGLLACVLWASGAQAAGEKRHALVIGNNQYRNVPGLQKAGNDAAAVGRELTRLGFQVNVQQDLGQKAMNKAINEFVGNIAGGGVGVFFFAGHGIQISNQNFLLPVDFDLPRSEADVEDQAVSVQKLQDKLAQAKAKFSLLVLDACRNNPLPKDKSTRSIGLTRGLAPPSAPNGQVVLYSAGANQEALDSLGGGDRNPNSVFTREFVGTIAQPGLSAIDVLRRIRSSVKQKAESVGHEQLPALYDQSDGDFYFAAGPAAAGKAAESASPSQVPPPMQPGQTEAEMLFWESVKDSRNPAELQAYLDKYPKGEFVSLARTRLNALKQNSAPAYGQVAQSPALPRATPVLPAFAASVPKPRGEDRAEFKLLKRCADAERPKECVRQVCSRRPEFRDTPECLRLAEWQRQNPRR